MEIKSFKNLLINILTDSGNSLIRDYEADKEGNSILITCSNNTKFSLQIHKSKLLENSNHEPREVDQNELREYLNYMREDNPLFFRILFTLLDMVHMDVISFSVFITIMENLMDNYDTLIDDYNQ